MATLPLTTILQGELGVRKTSVVTKELAGGVPDKGESPFNLVSMQQLGAGEVGSSPTNPGQGAPVAEGRLGDGWGVVAQPQEPVKLSDEVPAAADDIDCDKR